MVRTGPDIHLRFRDIAALSPVYVTRTYRILTFLIEFTQPTQRSVVSAV